MDYISYFKDAIREIFESLFGEKISLESQNLAPGWISSQGVAVVIGITGGKKGRVLLDMPRNTALELAQRVNATFKDEDLALFTMAEFCNIAAGDAITSFNNQYQGNSLRLAPSSIFAGTNSKLFSPKLNTVWLSFATRLGKIDFYIGFEGE
jgi:CheY-specific phosphatase CheX